MMKYVLFAALIWTTSAQFFRQGFNRQRSFRGGFQPQFRQQRFQQQSFNNNQIRGGAVDDNHGGHQYHFSWRHAGRNTKWVWGGAVNYCHNLGNGWGPISINDAGENNFVRNVIAGENMPYIWTGGQRSGNGWRWPVGNFVNLGAWSHTGGFGRPQPDNREGNENCLGVLNNVYNDGITWHDIGCSHPKPIICERS